MKEHAPGMKVKNAALWFLAGGATLHGLTHLFYWMVGALPLDFKLFVVTPFLNQVELWVSLALAVVFIFLALR